MIFLFYSLCFWEFNLLLTILLQDKDILEFLFQFNLLLLCHLLSASWVKSGVGGLLVIVPIYPASSPFLFLFIEPSPECLILSVDSYCHFTVIVSSRLLCLSVSWWLLLEGSLPALAGCLSKDGRAQPQVVAASSMTNGLFPVFVNRKTASLLSPIWIVPSCMDASSTFTVVCICEAGCFPVTSFRYSSRIFGLWIGFPITTTLLYLSIGRFEISHRPGNDLVRSACRIDPDR